MTKEELEKEAEEKYSEVDREFIDCQDEGEVFNIGYILGAESREKQIQIDAEQIRALQKQNGKLTDELKDLRQSIKDYGAGCYENGLRNGKRKLEEQLTKAKEIIKKFSEFANNEVEYDPEHPQEHTDLWNELCKEAEQFIKECK